MLKIYTVLKGGDGNIFIRSSLLILLLANERLWKCSTRLKFEGSRMSKERKKYDTKQQKLGRVD